MRAPEATWPYGQVTWVATPPFSPAHLIFAQCIVYAHTKKRCIASVSSQECYMACKITDGSSSSLLRPTEKKLSKAPHYWPFVWLFVRPVNSSHKWSVMWKDFSYQDTLMNDKERSLKGLHPHDLRWPPRALQLTRTPMHCMASRHALKPQPGQILSPCSKNPICVKQTKLNNDWGYSGRCFENG